MRLLDRYLLRELLVPLSYCLVGFTIFWITFDLFGELEDFQKEKLSAMDVAEYYLVKTPELLVTVLPVGFLLALLYALSNHGRHNELIAMRAAGRSYLRISVPYLAVGFLLSLALFYLNERLVPNSSALADQIRKRGQPVDQETLNWKHYVNFRNARENRIWNIRAYNLETHQMKEPHIEWNLPDGGRRLLIANRAIRTNDMWLFYDLELLHYPPGIDFERTPFRPVKTNMVAIPELSETPADIALQLRFSNLNAYQASKRPQFSLEEIQYLTSHLDLNKRDRSLLETQFHARLAQPWTCLVVALVALPFGASSNSRRNVFVGVASSIFICFVYFILLRFGMGLGVGGYIPPWLAAWLPNLLFAAIGIFLTLRAR